MSGVSGVVPCGVFRQGARPSRLKQFVSQARQRRALAARRFARHDTLQLFSRGALNGKNACQRGATNARLYFAANSDQSTRRGLLGDASGTMANNSVH